jgi:hypothetical protein
MGYIEDLRKVIGNQPLILVGVAVAIINEAAEFLLQKRRDGQWGVPGGFIELGNQLKKQVEGKYSKKQGWKSENSI